MKDLAIDDLQLFARVAARGPQPVPIFAVSASARHRLPKIKACLDYWAQWFNAGAQASTREQTH